MDGNEKPILPRFRIVIRWFAGVIAIIYFITAGSLYIRGLQSLSWIPVPGTVSELKIERVRTIPARNRMGLREPFMNRLYFSYTYDFKKQTYSSNLISVFDIDYGVIEKYERLSRKYPLGSKPIVFVNSANPSDSCLEPGVVRAPVVNQAVYGLLFATISLSTLLNKSGRQKSKSASTKEYPHR